MKWISTFLLPVVAFAATPTKEIKEAVIKPYDLNSIKLDKYLSSMTPDMVKESVDSDATGKPDTWLLFKKGTGTEKVLVMQLFDLNRDGKVDLVKHFSKGVLIKTEADLDYDGKVDVVSEYDPKTGALLKKYQADGKTNIVKHWFNNELRLKELDRNGDGKTDMWVYYQSGKVVKTEVDVNFDGKNIRVENGSLNKKLQQ